MNTNLVRILQSCIDDCERLLNEAERDKERYRRFASGELLKIYREGSDLAIDRIKNVKNQLYNLQLEAKQEE